MGLVLGCMVDTDRNTEEDSQNPLQNIESEGIRWLRSKAQSDGDSARLAKTVLQELDL